MESVTFHQEVAMEIETFHEVVEVMVNVIVHQVEESENENDVFLQGNKNTTFNYVCNIYKLQYPIAYHINL